MRYTVDAWLENGAPRLRLVDERGAVRLDWVCREDAAARADLQRLFKDLFLLASTAQICGIGTVGPTLADACLICGECVPEPMRRRVWVQHLAKEPGA